LEIEPSAIRRFFDIVATMKDVISLGIGEPDFVTPEPIVQAGIEALKRGETHYTSNSGLMELRRAIAEHMDQLYKQTYNPASEILVTVGVSEALYLAMAALLDEGMRSSSRNPASSLISLPPRWWGPCRCRCQPMPRMAFRSPRMRSGRPSPIGLRSS
jgi:aspartate/methionine/tyrosine aminotransferase